MLLILLFDVALFVLASYETQVKKWKKREKFGSKNSLILVSDEAIASFGTEICPY